MSWHREGGRESRVFLRTMRTGVMGPISDGQWFSLLIAVIGCVILYFVFKPLTATTPDKLAPSEPLRWNNNRANYVNSFTLGTQNLSPVAAERRLRMTMGGCSRQVPQRRGFRGSSFFNHDIAKWLVSYHSQQKYFWSYFAGKLFLKPWQIAYICA